MLLASRGGAEEARRAHNPKVVRSNRTPATNFEARKLLKGFYPFGGFQFY